MNRLFTCGFVGDEDPFSINIVVEDGGEVICVVQQREAGVVPGVLELVDCALCFPHSALFVVSCGDEVQRCVGIPIPRHVEAVSEVDKRTRRPRAKRNS